MAVALGKVEGVSFIRKFAAVPDLMQLTGKRDIWEYGSPTWGDRDYIYPEDGTAPINRISSSNAADTHNVLVFGLDINGIAVVLPITLTGLTPVVLPTPLWRVYRIRTLQQSTIANRATGFLGQIYVYEDTPVVAGVPTDKTKVRAFIDRNRNSTMMSQYCCPATKTGLFLNVEPKIIKKGAASALISGYVRPYGSVFSEVDVGGLSASGTSAFSVRNDIPIIFAERSDVVITCDVDTNNTGMGLSMYILLFDNEHWGLPQL